MDVAPATIEQIRLGEDGRVYHIDAESSTVAADLEAIDPGLKVRFSERGRCFTVYHEHHPGCPHNGDGGPGSKYLVRSVQATQGSTGVWTGLDQRLVDRIRYVQPGGRSGYDYADALERSYLAKREQERKAFKERAGEAAEVTAYQLRRDLGLGPYKGRIFKPREVS